MTTIETSASLPWPESLRGFLGRIDEALNLRPEFAGWPRGDRVLKAKQPAAIGKVLVEANHILLEKRAIAYLWVEQMTDRGDKIRLATAAVAPPKLKLLGKVDFVITVNWTAWQDLTPRQRVALIDHELCHCGVDEHEKSVSIPHDIEEFGSIVSRWGLWKPDLTEFGHHVARALQLNLFDAKAGRQPLAPGHLYQ